MKKWQFISSKLAFNNKWFKVRQDKVKLPNGKIINDYFVWPEENVVIIVPVTDQNKIVLVRQYKHAAGQIVIEYPGGYVEKNETPKQGAKRELLEETGYSCKKLTLLARLTNNPTKTSSIISLFLAKGIYPLKKSRNFLAEETEEIEILELSPKEVLGMVRSGKIWVSSAVSATYLFLEKLNLLKGLL